MTICGLGPFCENDSQHLVNSGQAEGVRPSMDGEVGAERAIKVTQWHPKSSFNNQNWFLKKLNKLEDPLDWTSTNAFSSPVMTSSLTWHHLSWCKAPLDSTSSTSPDIKRSWKPKHFQIWKSFAPQVPGCSLLPNCWLRSPHNLFAHAQQTWNALLKKI